VRAFAADFLLNLNVGLFIDVEQVQRQFIVFFKKSLLSPSR
jgi:hypothetical protein